jgi:hypothetical protein
MPTTETDMIAAIKTHLESKSRTIRTGQTYDAESGETVITESSESMEWSDDVRLLVEAIIEGWYEKARADGLDLGATTATTLDAGV